GCRHRVAILLAFFHHAHHPPHCHLVTGRRVGIVLHGVLRQQREQRHAEDKGRKNRRESDVFHVSHLHLRHFTRRATSFRKDQGTFLCGRRLRRWISRA